METKNILAITVLILVVILGAVLIAWPSPEDGVEPTPAPAPAPAPTPAPFSSENVRVTSPLPGAAVTETFTVRGEARGTWYFEASFPVDVRDANGNVVGRSFAEAQGEWMTEDFVPFVSTVTVENYFGPATLVLHKDNPSGLPELADAVEFSIVVQ